MKLLIITSLNEHLDDIAEYDSIVLFSFTNDEHSKKALELVSDYNTHHQTGFPVKGFILPVDGSC